ncbi:MAG: class I SAM-dependent methyltransferase [Chthoniobacterales bacterium]
MRATEIAAAFAEHGTWISRFVIDGEAYGGAFDAMNDLRVEAFFETFPEVATILELGSLEGGHTIALAQRPGVTDVLGVEGRAVNLARAQLAVRLLEARKVQLVEADLEHAELAQFGRFDAIFCCGLLYHLPEPWRLLRQFPGVSSRAFLWTHYCLEPDADRVVEGYAGRMQSEGGLDEPLSGLSSHAFWPTLEALQQMLRDAGFTRLRILGNEPQQTDGPAVAIAAWA